MSFLLSSLRRANCQQGGSDHCPPFVRVLEQTSPKSCPTSGHHPGQTIQPPPHQTPCPSPSKRLGGTTKSRERNTTATGIQAHTHAPFSCPPLSFFLYFTSLNGGLIVCLPSCWQLILCWLGLFLGDLDSLILSS